MDEGEAEVKKLLKDYPFNEWMEAADGCDVCGAKYQVRITYIDKKHNFGDVEYKIHHKPDCPDGIELGEMEEGLDVAGWEYMPKPFKFRGKIYYPLKSRANIGPCLECGRLVIGAPLILFIKEGYGGQLDFCFECAKKLKILEGLRR